MPEAMTQADTFWLCMDDPVNLMVITGFWEFREPLDYNRLFATLEARLAAFPRFRKKVVMPRFGLGSPDWVTDPYYDLRSHLHRIALPAPGSQNELQDMISSLKTTALDFNKPLWDIHLIENYGSGCVLFFRLHHCIADGIALMHVLHSMADTAPDAPWPEPGSKKKPGRHRKSPLLSFDSLVGSAGSVINSARGLVRTGKSLGKTVARETSKIYADPGTAKQWASLAVGLPTDVAAVLSRHLTMKADPNTAFKGKLGVQKRVAWTAPIPLDRIKELGHAISSATLNDVLIATVTGSMRRYLKTRNTPVNELDLRVTVPVNIRKPGTEFELGNKFSLVFLSLPVFLEDPVLRLKEVKRRMDKLKTSADPYVNFGLLSAIGFLPKALAQKASQVFGNKASGVMTNVPGPKKPLYFAGREITNIMFWVPRSGAIGLGISILSYNGNVTIGIASDQGLMPDPETFLEGFEEEFNFLIDLVRSGKIYEAPLVLHDRFAEAKAKPKVSSEEPGRCQATTAAGKQCRNAATHGDFCHIHREPDSPKRSGREHLLEDVQKIMKDLAD
ncbi:MAG: wax ester/triacylglycerol synthase family O-acyltransferase [Pseudomonadota bacterium]